MVASNSLFTRWAKKLIPVIIPIKRKDPNAIGVKYNSIEEYFENCNN